VQYFPTLGWLVPKKSLNDAEKSKRSYEAYFNDKSNETTTSEKIPGEVEIPNLMIIDYMGMENIIIEYNSNDVFGILTRLPLSP
jgi:hypothetical protein